MDESGKELLGPLGFSRFYNNQGTFSWAPCTVCEYDRERDMYLITWHSTGKPKWVKRLNLFFNNESRIGFRFRLRQARRRKEEVRCSRTAGRQGVIITVTPVKEQIT